MSDLGARLTGIRQSMRVLDGNGHHLGYVRDISGLSILVQEPSGKRVFWLPAAEVDAVERNEVRLTSALGSVGWAAGVAWP